MARLPKKALEDSLWFSKELGERLAQLRTEQKLTQQQVAELMGRKGKGSGSIVSRLETSRFVTPSLRLVADYLRACRADFSDIADILKRYTDQPTVVERDGLARVRAVTRNLPVVVGTQVERYDAKVNAARRADERLPESPEKRVRRARRVAADAMWRQKLHTIVVATINSRKLRIGGIYQEKTLQNCALRLWTELRKVGDRPSEFERLRDETAAALIAERIVPEPTVQAVLAEVVEFFRGAVSSGGLDCLPPAR